MIKELLSVLLAALLTLSLTACQKEVGGKADMPAVQTASGDFQKNMRQSKYFYITDMCETEDGVIFDRDGFLYYLDKEEKRATILCAKPDCPHTGKDCNAKLNTRGMWSCGDRLYCVTYTDGGNGGKLVTSMERDGTGRRDVQELLFAPGGSQSSYDRPVFYGGDVYYVYNDVLYRVPLGGKKEDAQALWGEDAGNGNDGPFLFTGNELHLTLWPDGEFVYFMANLEQSDGTYKDTLFAYGIKDRQVRQVWATPEEAEVGAWDTAGVSVSAWYVLDGTIYFYLAGNGFWRSSLTGGGTELLAATGDKAAYGTVLFSDDYMCLLNDLPGDRVGRIENEGGDAIFVYGLDGTLQKELPLAALFDEVPGIAGFAPLFISHHELYFIADAGAWGDIVNGTQYKAKQDILCVLNLDTGAITQIYTWQ